MDARGGSKHVRPMGAFNRMGGIPKHKLLDVRINFEAVGTRRSTIRFALLAARHGEVIAIGDLLVKALAIQADLCQRRSKSPRDRAIVTQQKQYEKIVDQLVWEHKTALYLYLATIRRFTKR
jgi:hypothetical protein